MRFLFSPYLAHHVVPLSKPPEVTGYLVEKLLIHPAYDRKRATSDVSGYDS